MRSVFPSPRSDSAGLSAAQLRQRYLVALALIAALTIISQVVIQLLIADQVHDSRVINIAGRQRMLSQKITKTALYLTQAPAAPTADRDRIALSEALSLWQRSHRGLQAGDSELGLPGKNSAEIAARFAAIEPSHQAMLSAAETLLAPPGNPQSVPGALATLRHHEPLFLKGMDDIVFTYDREAKHKIDIARWLEVGLLVITLVVLALEARFIFAPAVRRIRSNMRELADKIKVLETTQSQLVQSEKLAGIGQLAAGIAHEINTPIGYVRSNLGTLREYSDALIAQLDRCRLDKNHAAAFQAMDYDYLRSDLRALIQESRGGLDRVAGIVADLKNFSRIDHPERAPCDLIAGIESTLNVVRHELKDKVTIVREFAPIPMVSCLGSQINQVIMNLVLNAAHAIDIDTGGTITLRTGTEGARVWIEVADNGCGIPADIHHRIFEPFFTTRPVGQGTGLGLSISDNIIRKHGGQIRVSSAPGQGSCFRIELPIDAASTRPAVTEK